MPLSLKRNNSLSINSIIVISITINCKDLSSKDVLDELLTFQKTNQSLIKHPVNLEKIEKLDSSYGNIVYYIEPSKMLNKLFENAELLYQIYLIDIIGITTNIDRNMSFRNAVMYHKFCNALQVRGIINPPFQISDDDIFEQNIRRIHVIQPDFLEDPEIAQGLQITYSKNTDDNKVLYICSEELLALALKFCSPGITLIIDGHWEHKKRSDHGCWENADAFMIASSLKRLTVDYPLKIGYVRLWGCESGKISEFEKLSDEFDPGYLMFKNEYLPNFNEKEMANFRNRAAYYSTSQDSPYDMDSLAAQIMQHLPSIKRISAVPSFGYPFPPQEIPIYNIGSDTTKWRDKQYWIENELLDALGYPAWYKRLHNMKSITVIRDLPYNLDRWPPKYSNTISKVDSPSSS